MAVVSVVSSTIHFALFHRPLQISTVCPCSSSVSCRWRKTASRKQSLYSRGKDSELMVRRAVGEGGESGSSADVVYRGVYGPWTVDSDDIREVILYRSGLVTAATSFLIAASPSFLPESSTISHVIKQNHDLLYAIGTGGLGLSLVLIHIYVTPIKRFLQALWAAGVIGSLATYVNSALPLNESLPSYVFYLPLSIWLVGPLFASLTGLVFKEGLCYGKLEAGVLTFVIPMLLLGHLSGLMGDGVEHNLLALWMVLFAVFAARKFTQPIKDDIGDKSVFMFNALPEDEKRTRIQKLEQEQQ
ncbi:Conserved hypothetical membrane protein [Zostera marina]|uniref:Conserved hypothetical membrane protein n=1 Tax=Zostera marina TaxID=29655 RepID=A0A0K9PAX8_ZOSMR|nr:Conserved hypothetical membrane protein [Zostera marina]